MCARSASSSPALVATSPAAAPSHPVPLCASPRFSPQHPSSSGFAQYCAHQARQRQNPRRRGMHLYANNSWTNSIFGLWRLASIRETTYRSAFASSRPSRCHWPNPQSWSKLTLPRSPRVPHWGVRPHGSTRSGSCRLRSTVGAAFSTAGTTRTSRASNHLASLRKPAVAALVIGLGTPGVALASGRPVGALAF